MFGVMAVRSHLVVRRIEEETLSVAPAPSATTAAAGNLCEVKWVRKFYEGEIPSVSG